MASPERACAVMSLHVYSVEYQNRVKTVGPLRKEHMHVDAAGLSHGEWLEGMAIHFENYDFEFFPLLYSAAAWELPISPAFRRELTVPVPPGAAPLPDDVASVTAEWLASWASRAAHAGDLDDFDVETRGVDAYFAAWHKAQSALPVAWSDRYPEIFATDIYEAWREAAAESALPAIRAEIQPALVHAWERGLTHITTLPLTGRLSRPLGRHRLMTTPATWNSPEIVDVFDSWTPH